MTAKTRHGFAAGLLLTAAVVLAACSPPPPAKPAVVTIRLGANGRFLWNGKPVDSETLNRLLDQAAQQKPPPDIHVEPGGTAKDADMAKLIAAAERAGVTHIGFVGVETMP